MIGNSFQFGKFDRDKIEKKIEFKKNTKCLCKKY